MCGILGFVGKNIELSQFQTALELLNNRGPDDNGIYNDNNIFLGNTRLSIIDIDNGKQPLVSACSNYIIIFNGEIYNYKKLKHIYNYDYKTNSDTEVLLAGYINKGIKFLNDLEGMFSFCIYDKKLQKIIVTRDFFGIKPLIYSMDKNYFSFASEIKAILPIIPKQKIDFDGVDDFIVRKFIPSPNTIYKNIKKLEAGHYLEYNIISNTIKKVKYFDFKKQKRLLTKNLRDEIRLSIKKHLISDVLVTSFLSGGLDSTIIAYEANQILGNLKTYTIGFKDNLDDEDIKHSRIAAKFLNTDHNEIIVDKLDMDEFINLVKYFDEPFADTAILANYIIAKTVSKSSKVVLSGDGADEFFYGYNSYKKLSNYTSSGFMNIQNKNIYDFLLNQRIKNIFDKIEKDPNNIYQSVYYNMPQYIHSKIRKKGKKYEFFNSDSLFNEKTFRDYDIEVNLPDYYLAKVDKVSMINSIEVRVPFVDKAICSAILGVEYQKQYDLTGNGKKLLKNCYKNILPKEILYRKKQGFVRNWKSLIKTDIKELLNVYMTDEFFHSLYIDKKFVYYCIEKDDSFLEQVVWRVLILAIWYKNYKDFLL